MLDPLIAFIVIEMLTIRFLCVFLNSLQTTQAEGSTICLSPDLVMIFKKSQSAFPVIEGSNTNSYQHKYPFYI